MDAANHLAAHLEDIINVARLAPSVHNVQPWLVRTKGYHIEVMLDPKQTLHEGDPTGRQSVVSLGIFTEAVCIGVESVGLRVKGVTFKDNTAFIACQVRTAKKEVTAGATLLMSRCSDRSIYSPTVISKRTIKTLGRP